MPEKRELEQGRRQDVDGLSRGLPARVADGREAEPGRGILQY
jgi:hypothetical protein